MMRFEYAKPIQKAFPDRVTGILLAEGIHNAGDVAGITRPFLERAKTRLQGSTEGGLLEIQAWRRAFSAMGLKPTQYRCASEALMRRLRKMETLPELNPVVDICNAVSVAYAVPIAVFDCQAAAGDLQVRHSDGTEAYLAFSGDTETPDVGEVIFADEVGHAHARRWCNRQSLQSAVSSETSHVLIVAEALHATAGEDVGHLVEELATALDAQFRCSVAGTVFRNPEHFDSDRIKGG